MTRLETSPTNRIRVVYVVSQWGKLTETFVRREVDAARVGGAEITVLSLKRPAVVADDDPPVLWLHGPALVGALLRSVIRHPVLAAHALLVAMRWSRPATIRAHLYGVVVGVAAAAAVPPVDWVHAHFAWISATAADAMARVRRIPFSVMPHAFDIFDDDCVDRFLVRKLNRAAFVVVESDRIAAEVLERYGCRATTLRMGVSADLVRSGPVPRPVGRDPVVVTVGALGAKKGHDVLIKALVRVPGPWRCQIVGDGPERSALEELILSLGLEERVTLLGALPEREVIERLDGADVFCLASRITASGDRDGVPNVLIEAMARGLPIASTAVAGIPDLISDQRGLVVEPEDPVELAAAISRLLDDETLRGRVAEAARDHVMDDYTTEKNWTRLAALMTGSGPAGDDAFPAPASRSRHRSVRGHRSRG